MAVALSRGRSDHLQLQLQRKCKDRDDENKTSTHICNNYHHKIDEKRGVVVVPVVYYLSRNGQLQHPHFIHVPLSSPPTLFLLDFILRFNFLRGHSMASRYSWSSKRSYKNGYVWHDLQENDFIHPVHGGEYVLKGSEILETQAAGVSDFPAAGNLHRNQSGAAIDLLEYKVYKADASTQTDEKRRLGKAAMKVKDERSTELVSEEISPPPSDSSSETLESLTTADGRPVSAAASSSSSSSSQAVNHGDESERVNLTAGNCPSGRMKASSVLMSLISCGSISFRDCRAMTRGGNQRVDGYGHNNGVMMEIENNVSSSFTKMAKENKECFSGSLIDRKRVEFSALRRSSSYNADGSTNLKL